MISCHCLSGEGCRRHSPRRDYGDTGFGTMLACCAVGMLAGVPLMHSFDAQKRQAIVVGINLFRMSRSFWMFTYVSNSWVFAPIGWCVAGFMLAPMLGGMMGGMGDMMGGGMGMMGDGMGGMANMTGDAVGGIGDLGGSAVDGVGDLGGSAVGGIGDAGGAVGDFGGDFAGNVGDYGGSAFDEIGDFGGGFGDFF